MHDGFRQLQTWFKKGLATTLFLFLILGAGAAAVSALAAAMNALTSSASDGALQSTVVPSTPVNNVVSVPAQSPQPNQTGAASSTTDTASAPSVATTGGPTSTPTPGGDNQSAIDHMYSPVGEIIDSGGFALGSRLEQGFGSLLSGLLQTLFIERNDSASNEVNHG